MPSTYTLISSNVLSSSAASVTFSAIPATFTDLVLRVSGRTDRGSTFNTVLVEFNSNTSNYSYTTLTGQGSTASSTRLSSGSSGSFGVISGDTNTANTFGSGELYLPNYTASQNKPYSVFTVNESNAATIINQGVYANLWQNTSAITQIKLTPDNTTNFISGSSFYLYGIKNS
jgi:hypothetical protein